MGAFLSKPVTDKVSVDEEHSRLNFGVCSMQGWRFTQEDNHSCVPLLDEAASLFGVYDGHGGAEVSRHVSTLLPEYVLERECWKQGDVGKALSEAFLALDAHLGSRKGLKVLKKLAAEDDEALDQDKEKAKSSGDDDGESEDGSEENVRNLFKEAKMPLELLIAKYGGALAASHKAVAAGVQEADEGSPTGSKSVKNATNAVATSDEGGEEVPKDKEGINSSANASANESVSENADGSGVSLQEVPCKENGLPDDQQEATAGSKASVTRNGSGGRSKLRSRPNRIVMTDDDDEDDDDSSDEEYDENSSSLMEEGDGEGEDESSGDEDDDDDEEGEDLERGITTSDEFALNMLQGPGLDSGSTAVVAVVLEGGSLFVANAGDSRCIVSRNGKAVDMSVDHKPEDEEESQRIRDAGGEVTSEGRVNGGLNLSRALGDHAYKQGKCGARKQMISALPDVRHVALRPDEDEFMVLACDGIWNSMTSQDVVDFVRERLYKKSSKDDLPLDIKERRKLAEGVKLSPICGEMFDHCLAPNTSGDGTGCDNMTAVLVTFRESLWDGSGEDAKVTHADGEKAKDENGIVLLTPPPSPPPAVSPEGEEEDEESSAEEEEELDEAEESNEEEEEEELEEEGLDEEKEEEEATLKGRKGFSAKSKGCATKRSPEDEEGLKRKRKKTDDAREEEEDAVAAS